MSKKEYDEEPVYYCKRCLSLNIKQMPFMENKDYCESCGAVEVGIASFEEWEEMYREKYGHSYLVRDEKKKRDSFMNFNF